MEPGDPSRTMIPPRIPSSGETTTGRSEGGFGLWGSGCRTERARRPNRRAPHNASKDPDPTRTPCARYLEEGIDVDLLQQFCEVDVAETLDVNGAAEAVSASIEERVEVRDLLVLGEAEGGEKVVRPKLVAPLRWKGRERRGGGRQQARGDKRSDQEWGWAEKRRTASNLRYLRHCAVHINGVVDIPLARHQETREVSVSVDSRVQRDFLDQHLLTHLTNGAHLVHVEVVGPEDTARRNVIATL